jgi:hypothetical protein
MSIRVNGMTIWHLDLAYTIIIQGLLIKDIGIIICSMELAYNNGPIQADMKDPTSKVIQTYIQVKSRVRASIHGPIKAIIKANGPKTKYKELESTFGVMAETIRAIGRIIKCMDKGFMSGRTAEGIKETINTTKRKGSESIFGPTVKDSKAPGLTARDRVLAKLSISLVIKKLDFGKMIRK